MANLVRTIHTEFYLDRLGFVEGMTKNFGVLSVHSVFHYTYSRLYIEWSLQIRINLPLTLSLSCDKLPIWILGFLAPNLLALCNSSLRLLRITIIQYMNTNEMANLELF